MKYIKTSYTASSLIYILLGLALLIWPELSLKVVCYLFGAVILIKGISSVITFFRTEDRFFFSYFTLIFGLSATALGAFLLFSHQVVVSILPLLVGILILFDGVVRTQSAFELRAVGHRSWWSFLLLALISVILGFVMIFNPFASVQVLVMAIGVFLLLEGIVNLASALYAGAMLRTLRKTAEEVSGAVEDFFNGQTVDGSEHGEQPPILDAECRDVDENK